MWLIRDSGYTVQPWMMTPIPDAAENTPEGIYTARHESARNVIERVFGTLKQRFRCLKKTRLLHYNHGRAGGIIRCDSDFRLIQIISQCTKPYLQLVCDHHQKLMSPTVKQIQ
jgi:hypothetical protein